MLINKPVFGDPKSTLVVVPLALIHQWAAEIKQLTRLGSLRVVEHQGTKRTTNPKDLEKYDVIVTTYQTLRSEHEVGDCPDHGPLLSQIIHLLLRPILTRLGALWIEMTRKMETMMRMPKLGRSTKLRQARIAKRRSTKRDFTE